MSTQQNVFQSGALFALLLITAFIYWPGLNGPLILDDVANLDILRELSEQQRLSAANLLAERGGWTGGRSVSWLSFMWSWLMAPADVWVFKLHNLLLHLLNGVLVFFFARVVFDGPCQRPDANRRWMALLVCAFWLLAPIQVSSVLYLVQRMTVLAGTFVLLGLLAYCVGRRLSEERPILSCALIAFSLLVCWPLATLSKETGALLPVLLIVTEIFVEPGPRQHGRWAPKLVAVLGVGILLAGAMRAILDPGWITQSYGLRDFTLSQRLLTQPRVLVDYALNVLQLPGGSELGLFHDDFVVSSSFLAPLSTLPTVVFVAAILGVSWRMRATSARMIFFGLVFFLVGHCLEAGPFALEMYFEHRNYLPAVGLWIAFVAALSLLAARWNRRWIYATAVCIALGLHLFSTSQRVFTWTSWNGIISANVSAHPNSVRAHAGAAASELTTGNIEAGLQELAVVHRLGGSAVSAAVVLKSLAGYCIADRKPDSSIYRRLAALTGLRDDPYTISALKWFAETADSEQCTALDLASVAARLELLAGSKSAYRDFGFRWMLDEAVARISAAAGRRNEATKLFLRALERAPSSVRAGITARMDRLNSL